ncbi:NUDIX hydrolase [Microbacterium sp. zg-YB36]|uniref:NUDIX hydrolase n=1 Tax=Microbacterium sp. zg-YB36 TaxID=2969407 RepID=UPI00214C4346|nr:NUDIX hydrolase [Microbacterium sp. zg-YB36]MDL5352640.1 NUDIX hydrolase [Microbacterium sp. zg-YB36]
MLTSDAVTPGDPEPDLPVAATVVLLRDGAAGVEVLLLQRPDRGSFAGAWVFPGGMIEDGDHPGPDTADEDVARRAGVRETAEEVGLVVDPDVLVPLALWVPPVNVALRIRTWFFVARVPSGPLQPAPAEVVQTQWTTPADALAAHGRGELRLYPPTWVTLHGLIGHDDVDSALAAARLRGIHRFETRAREDAGVMLWQEDGEYEPDAGSDARHRLEIAALPWRYTRSAS